MMTVINNTIDFEKSSNIISIFADLIALTDMITINYYIQTQVLTEPSASLRIFSIEIPLSYTARKNIKGIFY